MLAAAAIPVLVIGALSTASLFVLADRADDRLAAGQGELAADLHTAAMLSALIIGALLGVTLLLVPWVSRRLADQITEPIRVLGAEARRLAETELPSLVDTLRSTDGSGEMPAVDLIDIDAEGEVADLAMAFNSLRATTVELAARQAIGRSKDLAGVLVNLGRRNQQLIGRQLRFIDRLEATESDPDALDNLFTLDQLATRMRRNAESLLVIAGERAPRQATEPQPVHEVLRAAASEVEHFTRVSLASIEPALIAPSAVSDLTHLMAELIENATNFSPHDTTVDIVGSWDDRSCYTLSVIDHGPGMSRLELAEANARISQMAFDETPTSYLGLLVVGRLAARHKIDARLIESAAVGTTAKVTLPARCVTAMVEAHDGVIGSRLQTSGPTASRPTSGQAEPSGARWPLPRRVSLPIPAPQHSTARHRKVPEPLTASRRNDPHLIDEIDAIGEALELPVHTEGANRAEPALPPARRADQDGRRAAMAGNGLAGATPEAGGVAPSDGDETAGLPIPPFRARESKIPAISGATSVPERSERSHPSNPTFRSGGNGATASHLEIVTAMPEIDPEVRAVEVRDRLGRFTKGVAAAKAEDVATSGAGPARRNGGDGRIDVVPFRQRSQATAMVSPTTEDERL